MARPRKPDSELKHKRRERPSTTRGEQLDIPEPSKKEKAKWKHIVQIAMSCVVKNDRRDNIAPKHKMHIRYSGNAKEPEWFPRGLLVKRDELGTVLSYNAEQVLLACWQRKLCSHNPHMVYAELREFNSDVRKLLDGDGLQAYNGCFEIDIGE